MSNMNQQETDTQQRLVLFASSSSEAKQFGDSLLRLGYSSTNALSGGIVAAIDWAKEHTLPPLLFVDIDGDPSPLDSLMELGAICGPSCHIVTFGSEQSVDLYRALLTQGMFDYLAKPVTLDRLASTIQDAEKGIREEVQTGRTIAVTGASGGVGSTLVSVGLAYLLSKKRRLMTALVDFDRSNGAAALMLGFDGDAGLAGALNAENIDTRLLRRSIGKAADRLYLVAQTPDFHIEEAANAEQVLALGGSLCRMFNQTVWDLPSSKPDGSLAVLMHSQVRIIVTDFTVQDARNTLRVLKEIGDETSGQRILLVHNDARQFGESILSKKSFEEFVGRPIDIDLPNVGTTFSSTLLEGQVSFTECPELEVALLALADMACGKTPEEVIKKRSYVERLRGVCHYFTRGRKVDQADKPPVLKFKGD